MDISYFQKINNTYKSQSKQETDLYLLNRHVDECFSDTIDYHVVKRNEEPFELLIIKDTDGNTFKKKIKSKHSEPFNLGDYIEWNNQIWLVTLLDPNEKTYHSGYMYLCTVPLRWQNSEGKIVERYAYSEDFTKYSSGVTGNNTIRIGDNQYGLTLPIDSETKKLNRDMRFPIDFDDSEKPDIYMLTNRKVNLNNNEYFGRGGTMILTMSFDSFDQDEDKHITMDNGKKVWICNYKDIGSTPVSPSPSNPDETTVSISATIQGKKELKCKRKRTYAALLSDMDGNTINWDNASYHWNVVSDFGVKQIVNGNQIELYVEDDSLIGESFILSVIKSNDNSIIAEIDITIAEEF